MITLSLKYSVHEKIAFLYAWILTVSLSISWCTYIHRQAWDTLQQSTYGRFTVRSPSNQWTLQSTHSLCLSQILPKFWCYKECAHGINPVHLWGERRGNICLNFHESKSINIKFNCEELSLCDSGELSCLLTRLWGLILLHSIELDKMVTRVLSPW